MHTIQLTPVQSVTIHGWSYPKRTLTWNDVCTCKWIDVKLLAGTGISQEVSCSPPSLFPLQQTERWHRCVMAAQTLQDMQTIQPDVHEWISRKGVSFSDVPLMTRFPLHPVLHLGGDISCLVEHKYSSKTLLDIGFTFMSLKDDLGMQPSWMKMMSFTAPEWRSLGMTRADMECMSPQDVWLIFGVCKDELSLAFILDHTGCARTA